MKTHSDTHKHTHLLYTHAQAETHTCVHALAHTRMHFSPRKAPQGGSTVLKKIFPKALITKTMVLVNSQPPHTHIPRPHKPHPHPCTSPYLTPQVLQKKKKKKKNTKTKQKRFWQREKRAFHWQAWVRAIFTYRSTALSPLQHRAPPLSAETWPPVSFWNTHTYTLTHTHEYTYIHIS